MPDELFSITTPDQVPSGSIIMFGGTVAPVGWLLCDGTSYTTAGQPGLFAAIGYNFGGSGANFNVPNFNAAGRFPQGTNTTPGATGGRTDALLNHSHVQSDVIGTFDNHSGGNVAAAFNPANAGIINQQHSSTSVSTTGNGTDTRPPFQTVTFIIKI